MLQTLTYGKKYAAIEFAENGSFNYLQLNQKKNEFIISDTKTLHNLKDVISTLKGQKHIFLVVNNEQVLYKEVNSANTSEKSILRTAFPNITISDFYFESIPLATTTAIAIIRKEVIDSILSNFNKEGISVIDFSLGNLALKNLSSFVNHKNLYSSNALIEFDEHTITTIKKEVPENETYLINDLEVSNTDVLPLSGIIGYYSKNPSSNLQKELQKEYFEKRFFDIGLKTGLGFLLAILLINFMFFSNYRQKVGDLTGELQLSATYKNQLNTLQNQVNQKKRLVKSVNSASNSKLSRYIDELGFSVPETILLSQINFQPVKGVVRADKQLIFDLNQIVVKGTSKENENFTNWIAKLERKDWIKKIAIVAYGKGKKTTKMAIFEFTITMHE